MKYCWGLGIILDNVDVLNFIDVGMMIFVFVENFIFIYGGRYYVMVEVINVVGMLLYGWFDGFIVDIMFFELIEV